MKTALRADLILSLKHAQFSEAGRALRLRLHCLRIGYKLVHMGFRQFKSALRNRTTSIQNQNKERKEHAMVAQEAICVRLI
jgi:hypothetical protein